MVRIGLEEQRIVEVIESFGPHVCGISDNFTTYFEDALTLSNLIKNRFPSIILVAGGVHSGMAYDDVMRLSPCDIVVRGEGEYAFVEVLDCLSKNTDLSGVKGIAWRDSNGSVCLNDVREPIANLDELPLPAYNLLNMKLYLQSDSQNFSYSKRFPIGHLITSRGCLYNCIFCSTPHFFKKFRPRSPKNVLDEIELLINKYHVKEIFFHDDSLLCDTQRVYDLCNGMIERGLNITWSASQGLTVWRVSAEMLNVMYKSGMYRLGLPIETGSKSTLKFIRKPVNFEKTLQLIDQCNQLGIYTHANFIIGFPYETKEEIDETAAFIYKSNIDFVKVLISQPFFGSDMYNIYSKEGLLDKKNPWTSSAYKTKYDTLVFTANQLNEMRETIMNTFFKKRMRDIFTINGIRKFIIPKLTSMEKMRYFLKLVSISLSRLIRGKAVLGV